MKKPLPLLALLFACGIVVAKIFQGDVLLWFLAATLLLGLFTLTRALPLSSWLLVPLIPICGGTALRLEESILASDHLSLQVHQTPAWVKLEGTVAGLPDFIPSKNPGYGRHRFFFDTATWSAGQRTFSCSGRVLVTISGTSQSDVKAGQSLTLNGLLEKPVPAMNPGSFDYKAYLGRRDIFFQMKLRKSQFSTLHRTNSTPASIVNFLAGNIREHVNKALKIDLEQEPGLSAMLSGMILGYRSEIPDDISLAFQKTGTFHILAVSGQNLSFLASIIIMALRSMGVSRWRCGILVIPVLLIYCASVGWQPGCLRSYLMAFILLSSWLLIRPHHMMSNVSFAALATLTFDPRQLFEAGFQLSFAVVLALILISPPLYEKMKTWFAPDPFLLPDLVPRHRRVWEWVGDKGSLVFSGSLAAWVGSLPFSLIYFNLFSPITLLANIVVVPVAGLVLAIGFISFIGGLIHPIFSALYNNANFVLLKMLGSIIVFLSQVPGGHFYVNPTLWERKSPDLRGHVLSAGKAQPMVIETQAGAWVIDPGRPFTVDHIVIPYLHSRGINKVAGIILTHPEPEVTSGLPQMTRAFNIERVYVPEYFGRLTRAHKSLGNLDKKIVQFLKSGQSIDLTSTTVMHVHFAGDRESKRFEPMVFSITHKSGSILFYPRDTPEAREALLVAWRRDVPKVYVQGDIPIDPRPLPERCGLPIPELTVITGKTSPVRSRSTSVMTTSNGGVLFTIDNGNVATQLPKNQSQ
ncbi:MAG: ComEC/Rec2 family competence protein [Verrucomicrobiota bacterium]|nr:ComEC/Rec2 family competence protein [Verrucomicrobiota bacterium]